MRFKQYVIPFYIFAVMVSSCSSHHQHEPADSINTDIVLSIDTFHVTKYEVDKNYKAFAGDYLRQKGHVPDTAEIKKWLNDFTGKNILLADGYHRRLDQDKQIVSAVRNAACFIIAQPGGLMAQKLAGTTSSADGTSTQTTDIRATTQKENQAMDKYISRIAGQARVSTNYPAIDSFFVITQHCTYGPNHKFQPASFEKILKNQISTYTAPDQQKVVVTIHQFIDFYNTLLLRQPITSPTQITTYLNDMALNDYIYRDAVRLGITRQPKFILDEKNFKNELVFNKYRNKLIDTNIHVDPDKLLQLYNAEEKDFVQATSAVVSLYYFSEKRDAISAMIKLKRNPSADIHLNGLTTVQNHLTINFGQSKLDHKVERAVFDIKVNTVSIPVESNGKIIVIKKESESGHMLQPYADVQPLLIKQLKNQQLAAKITERVNQLKAIYPVDNKINLPDLYNITVK